MAYLKDLQSLVEPITAANGTTIPVTAESETALTATRAASGYTGSLMVDPENTLVKELNRSGLVDVAITKKSGYLHGMVQPAILVLNKDGTALYSWAIALSMVRSCFSATG